MTAEARPWVERRGGDLPPLFFSGCLDAIFADRKRDQR